MRLQLSRNTSGLADAAANSAESGNSITQKANSRDMVAGSNNAASKASFGLGFPALPERQDTPLDVGDMQVKLAELTTKQLDAFTGTVRDVQQEQEMLTSLLSSMGITLGGKK